MPDHKTEDYKQSTVGDNTQEEVCQLLFYKK